MQYLKYSSFTIYTLRNRLYFFTDVMSSGTTVISLFSYSSKKKSGFLTNQGFFVCYQLRYNCAFISAIGPQNFFYIQSKHRYGHTGQISP